MFRHRIFGCPVAVGAALVTAIIATLVFMPSSALSASSEEESHWSKVASKLSAAGVADSLFVDSQWVYLDFWASWCPPCKKSFPWMNSLSTKFERNEVVVVAVCLDRDADKGRSFVERSEVDFPVLYDSEAELARLFDVKAMPTAFLIGPSREIESVHTGFGPKDGDELEAQFRELLATGASKAGTSSDSSDGTSADTPDETPAAPREGQP